MSSSSRNSEIGDERVFRLAAPVRDVAAVVVCFGQGNAIQGLGNGADLVQLDENRVCDFTANGFLKNGRVGAKASRPRPIRGESRGRR